MSFRVLVAILGSGTRENRGKSAGARIERDGPDLPANDGKVWPLTEENHYSEQLYRYHNAIDERQVDLWSDTDPPF